VETSKWTDKQFGKVLKKHRVRRGWTQPQMAEMLADKGVQPMHDTTVAKIEAGTRSVRINEAAGFADVLGIPLDALLGRRSSRAAETALGWAFIKELRDTAQYQATTVRRMGTQLSDALDGVGFAGHEFYGITDELCEIADRVYESLHDAESHLGELAERADRIIGQRQEPGREAQP
jgi:transcriptional regulator with XRE-family HTH domain